MSSKHAKSSYNLRSRRGEAEHVPTAAERVFNTPYVARQIVQWAGLSGANARLITPGLARLERSDPAFRQETNRMLLTPKVVAPKYWWDNLSVEYRDENNKLRRRETLMSVDLTGVSTREEKLAKSLYVEEFDEHNNTVFEATPNSDTDEVAEVKHEQWHGGVVTFALDDSGTNWAPVSTSRGPYVRKNQSLRPDVWLPMIRFDTHSAEDGTLTIDEP